MKKYLCCLLALGLLAGCSVENDDSEIISPPAEQIPEDNELANDGQTSTENDAADGNAQDTIEYIKKIDDDKDYVYLMNTQETTSDDSDYRKLEDNYEYADFDTSDLLQWMAISYSPNPIYEQIVVNIDSDDAHELNQFFEDVYYAGIQYENYHKENKKEIKTGLFNEYRWIQRNEILMIYEKSGTFRPHSDGDFYHRAYYFDLTSGKQLTNDDLLKKFSVDKDKIDDIVFEYAIANKLGYQPKDLGEPIPHEELDRSNGSMMKSREYLHHFKNIGSTSYSYYDNSVLYIENDNLYLLVAVSTPDFYNRYLFHKILLE